MMILSDFQTGNTGSKLLTEVCSYFSHVLGRRVEYTPGIVQPCRVQTPQWSICALTLRRQSILPYIHLGANEMDADDLGAH